MGDLTALILLTLGVLAAVLAVRAVLRRVRGPRPGSPGTARRHRRAADISPEVEVNARSILVDGSNVMFWIDNKPTVEALQRVLAALRNAGNDPILCFDANIGYKLVNQHMDPAELAKFFGVARRNILICPSGTDGDAMILRIAVEKSLPVVSNDRYRDYPDLAPRIERMGGRINAGKVDLKLRPAEARSVAS